MHHRSQKNLIIHPPPKLLRLLPLLPDNTLPQLHRNFRLEKRTPPFLGSRHDLPVYCFAEVNICPGEGGAKHQLGKVFGDIVAAVF